MTQLSRNNTSAAAILKCSNQNQEVCTKLTFLYGFFLWKAKSHFIVGVLGQTRERKRGKGFGYQGNGPDQTDTWVQPRRSGQSQVTTWALAPPPFPWSPVAPTSTRPLSLHWDPVIRPGFFRWPCSLHHRGLCSSLLPTPCQSPLQTLCPGRASGSQWPLLTHCACCPHSQPHTLPEPSPLLPLVWIHLTLKSVPVLNLK